MRLLVLILPFGALAAVPNAVLSLRLDFRTRARAEITASLVSGALALLLAWHGFGVWCLAWQAVVGTGVRALMLWILSNWRPRGHFDINAFRELFRFGGYMLLANTLNTLSIRLQSLLIGRIFNARVLGFYSLAQETQQVPAQFMSSLLNRVGLPVFSTVAEQPEKFLGAMRLSLRTTMFVFVPCMVGIAVIAGPLVEILYGSRWTPAAPILSILALAAIFWPLHVLNLAAISARGRSDLIFWLEIIKCLTAVPLIVAGSFFGAQAVAWAVLISNMLCVIINTSYSKQLFGYSLLAQLLDQRATFLLATLSSLCALLVSRLVEDPAIALACATSAAITMYAGGSALTNVTAWRELLELLKTLSSSLNGSAQKGLR